MDLIVFDVLCRPGSRVRLRCRLERADWFRRPVSGRPVRFREVPLPGRAGPGIELGQRLTDRWGYAELPLNVETPGERYFAVSTPALHGESGATGTGLVCCRTTARTAVVLDIDGTLTSEANTLRRGAAGACIKDAFAVGAVVELASRYDLVYLTGRRRQLVNPTRDWLLRQGLPVAPLFAQMSHVPLPGFVSGWWKTHFLRALRARHPNLTVGVGNTAADAHAYARNGMLPVIFAKDGHRRWRPLNALTVTRWDQVGELLLGSQHCGWRGPPARVVLGGGATQLEMTTESSASPPGASAIWRVRLDSMALQTHREEPFEPWHPPQTDWPTLRAGLLTRLRGNRHIRTLRPGTPSGGDPLSAIWRWLNAWHLRRP